MWPGAPPDSRFHLGVPSEIANLRDQRRPKLNGADGLEAIQDVPDTVVDDGGRSVIL